MTQSRLASDIILDIENSDLDTDSDSDVDQDHSSSLLEQKTEEKKQTSEALSNYQINKKALTEVTGSWLSTLRGYIACELDIILDALSEQHPKFSLEEVKLALENLLQGELEHFTSNVELASYLCHLQEMLMINPVSLLYRTITQRDNHTSKPNKWPSTPELFKFATLDALNMFAHEKLNMAAQSEEIKEERWEKMMSENKVIFIPDKSYTFAEMTAYFHRLCAPYEIDTNKSDIFEHTLLRWAGIKEFSSFCQFGTSVEKDEQHYQMLHILIRGVYAMHLKLSLASMQRFISYLNHKLSGVSAEHTPPLHQGVHSIQLNINPVVKLILSQEFKEFFTAMLANPVILNNYQLLCRKKNISFNQITEAFLSVGKKYNLNKGYVTQSILRGFGVTTQLPSLQSDRYLQATRYDGFVTETDFFLSLSKEEMTILLVKINIQFPNAAKIIEANEDSSGQLHQQLAIKNEVIVSQDFLNVVNAGLQAIKNNEPDLFEIFEMESGVRKTTTVLLVRQLKKLADEFKEDDSHLSTSLTDLALSAEQRQPKEKVQEKSFDVEQAIALHEVYCKNKEEHTFFKQGKKKEIKDIQDALGTRSVVKSLQFSFSPDPE